MGAGRCMSCGAELVERLGDVECSGCGRRVLRRDVAARPAQRDPSAAPWDPPKNVVTAPVREDEPRPSLEPLGLLGGGLYRPRVREVGSSWLATEKWIFLAAFFLGNIFVTYAYLYSGGAQGAAGVSFVSVVIYVAGPTALAAFVVYSHGASIKNGCLFAVVVMVLFGAYGIYRAAHNPHGGALLAGLIVQTLLYGWLAAILMRENELE